MANNRYTNLTDQALYKMLRSVKNGRRRGQIYRALQARGLGA